MDVRLGVKQESPRSPNQEVEDTRISQGRGNTQLFFGAIDRVDNKKCNYIIKITLNYRVTIVTFRATDFGEKGKRKKRGFNF